jgi:hypothetical protein
MRHSRAIVGWFTVGVLGALAFASPAAAQPAPVTIQLAAQNGSGIAGTVTLTDLGNNQTRVVVNITPATGDHPAHIHMGSCANLDPTPEFPLTNVQNGASTTVVDQSLTTIMRTQRAVNLHLSAAQVATYVACADIPVVSSQPPTAPAAAPAAAAGRGAVSPSGAPAPAQLPRTGLADTYPIAAPLIASGIALMALGLVLRRRLAR